MKCVRVIYRFWRYASQHNRKRDPTIWTGHGDGCAKWPAAWLCIEPVASKRCVATTLLPAFNFATGLFPRFGVSRSGIRYASFSRRLFEQLSSSLSQPPSNQRKSMSVNMFDLRNVRKGAYQSYIYTYISVSRHIVMYNIHIADIINASARACLFSYACVARVSSTSHCCDLLLRLGSWYFVWDHVFGHFRSWRREHARMLPCVSYSEAV